MPPRAKASAGCCANRCCSCADPALASRAMAGPAPTDPSAPARYTCEQYLGLVASGALNPDDDVELLEGVIVAMSPSNLPYEAGIFRDLRGGRVSRVLDREP